MRLVTAAISVGVGLLALLGPAGEALGQQVVMVRASGGPGAAYKAVSPGELEGYCRMLGFEEGESAAAAMLLEGYREGVRAAQEARRVAMERARGDFESTGDHEVLREGMRKSGATLRSRTEELERAFFSDLKLLGMNVEESEWARVERARRRVREMDSGLVSTANVDLVALVEKLAGSWREREEVGLILERYAVQLDGLLAERTRAGEGNEMMGRFDASQLEAMAAAAEKQRAVALRIRALNDSVVGELAGLIAEEEPRAALEAAYQLAKFPRVYRESHASRLLGAAAGFEDLSAAQRDAIESLRASHDARAASLNARWAREFADAERKGDDGAGLVRVMGAGAEESEAAKAARVRRELDRETEARLRDLLDEAQKSRLPEREREPQERWGGEAATIRFEGG